MTIKLSDLDLINIEQIKQFPNKEDAHIKSYQGKLAITNDSVWGRVSAYWSGGTPFQETVQVIKATCSRVLEMMSTLPPSPAVLKKIQEIKQGLTHIRQVYTVRYGQESVSELDELERQISQTFQLQEAQDQEEGWELIAPEAGKSRWDSLEFQTKEKGYMHSAYAGLKTAVLFSTGGGLKADPRSRVLNSGMQLRSGDVHAFIDRLGIDEPFQVVAIFYLGEKSGINIHQLSEVKAMLDDQPIEKDSSIIIPLNFMSQEVFGRNHIALIVIKDNTVEYYDSQGICSVDRSLKDESNLRYVLAYCQQKWTHDGKIVENPYLHQTDANNCGMFVCKRLQEIFKFKIPLGVWETEGPSVTQIEKLRENIANIAYPVEQPTQSLAVPNMDAEGEIDAILEESRTSSSATES